MTEPHETEFKLHALRPIEVATVDATLRELGLPIGTRDRRDQIDVYLDDAEHGLARAGLGLRLRQHGQHRRLTVKTRGSDTGGLFVREEHEADWAGDGLPTSAGELPAALRDLVEPFVRDRPLLARLQLSTQRELRVVQHDGRDLCELVVDHVTAMANERETTFAEVELEVLDDLAGTERLAHELLQRLPLQPATADKPTHALQLLGLDTPPPPAAPVLPHTPLVEALPPLLRRHLTALQQAEAGVRTDRGPTALHSMRVAVRRLRCLLRAFRSAFATDVVTRLLEQLAELGRQLGHARDLDVLLAELASGQERLPEPLHQGCALALARAKAERDLAHAQLRDWLRSGARATTQAELERALLAPDPHAAAATQPLDAAVRQVLIKATTAVQRLAGELPAELPFAELHTLRLATKRLRYLVEEFLELPGHDRPRALQRLVDLQHAAGVVCDHEMATRRLIEWLQPGAANGEAPLVAAALGGLAVDHARLARKARRAARKTLERVDRKKFWRQLEAGDDDDAILAP
ncbi:MAG: CHAD domain-containing protein [Planctomycetes bacterium]|jgi:inorganic triphosphatase YgiF|nr:CHAD domain-containing protein [Planctomycetota bacterium]